MTFYFNILFIATIVVLIVEISGFMDHLSMWISSLITKGNFITKDIFGTLTKCSFCVSWWVNLVYMIISGNFSIFNTMIILLISFFTPVITNVLYKTRDIIGWLLNKIKI